VPDTLSNPLKTDRFILVKTSLVDYPGKVSAVVFLPGCHLRCPYCHNPELVEPGRFSSAGLDWDNPGSFREFLRRRSGVIGAVVFSGGEALLHPLLKSLIEMVREYNLAVKIDTSGLLPDLLKPLIQRGLVNYVAMDLKTLPERYGELGWKNGPSAEPVLIQTLELLEGSGIAWEIRTTVVPPLVNEEVLRHLAPIAETSPIWVWQVYRKGETLNPLWSSLKAPDEEELLRLSRTFPAKSRITVR
jgi:pyruvate formate lyase activating enzyme